MKHKSNDYKITAVNYYLVEDKTQEEVCKISMDFYLLAHYLELFSIY